MREKMRNLIKGNDKKSVFVYFLLRTLIIICMIREIMNGNFQNAALCVLSLVLFLLPFFIEKKMKIELPSVLEIIIFCFIFAAEILGEINNFYGTFPYWDTILHTLNGFLCASVDFSLVYLLNENSKSFHLAPVFVALVAFCFSMTIGVAWEFFEYGMDTLFGLDMQKDEIVDHINTVTFDPEQDNHVVSIPGITHTVLYGQEDVLLEMDGYLDIGLHDTMKDMFVNCIGAFVFSVFGYLYMINKKKFGLAGEFITKRATLHKSEN